MSAYQRFLPRDGTRTTAHVTAEAAEAAEAKAAQASPAAEALLKPAEVRPGDRQVQQASAEVQRRQRDGIPELQQLQRGPAPRIDQRLVEGAGSHPAPDDGAAQLGIPTEWCEGVLRLSIMPAPCTYPAHAWPQLITDAERFLDDWAQQAAALGWPGWELFGCHKRAPWGRIQGMGLVLLLRGDEIAALTETEAVIRTRTGARQTYRRRPHDPLHPAERCLLWELG